MFVDYFSIPQPTSEFEPDGKQEATKQLGRAVDSIPFYIAVSEYFFALTPAIRHANTKCLCDPLSYKSRGWCRLEFALWNVLSGNKPTLSITAERDVYQMPGVSCFGSMPIGMGVFTCCDRFGPKDADGYHVLTDAKTGKESKIRCDRHKLGASLSRVLRTLPECYLEKKEMDKFRATKCMRRFPLRGLHVPEGAFQDEPTDWEGFCAMYHLPSDQGYQLSDKCLKEHNCLQPLMYAVFSCNETIVKMILNDPNKKAIVNYAMKDKHAQLLGVPVLGFNALHAASASCFPEFGQPARNIISMLIDAGGDPYKPTKQPFPPMQISLLYRNKNMYKWAREKYGWGYEKPLTIMSGQHLLHGAFQNGIFELVKEIAENDPSLFNTRAYYGEHPIFGLAMSGLEVHYQDCPANIFDHCIEKGLFEDIHCVCDWQKAKKCKLRGVWRFAMWICRSEFRIRTYFNSDPSTSLSKMSFIKHALAHAKHYTLLQSCAQKGSSLELLQKVLDRILAIENPEERHYALHRENAIGFTALALAEFEGNHAHAAMLRAAIEKDKTKKASQARLVDVGDDDMLVLKQ